MPKPSSTVSKARPEWLVQFGHRLLVARGQAGLTQQALGAPDLSKSFISLLETGRSHPSVETIVSLARRTRTSIASLLLDEAELRRETAVNLLRLVDRMNPTTHSPQIAQLIAAAGALQPDMPPDLAVQAALTRAHTTMLAQHLDEAARWAEAAASLAERHRLPGAAARAAAYKGMIAVRRGAYAAAIPVLEAAVEKMRRAKIVRSEEGIWALLSLGAARFYLRQASAARRAYQRALELSTRLRLERLRGRALEGLGLAEWTRNRRDAAVDFLSRAYAAFELGEDLGEMSRTLNNLGAIRREQGLHEEALKVLQRALQMKGDLGDTRGRSAILDEIALVQLDARRLTQAAGSARRAIALARQARDAARVAGARVTLARVQAAQGRRNQAVASLRTAAATLRRLGLKDRAAQAFAERERLLQGGRGVNNGRGWRTQAASGAHQAAPPGPAAPAVESLALP